MARHLKGYSWIFLLAIAVAVTLACSSSSTGPEEHDSGGIADALTSG
jgi:hypothetical protein